jgi:hypothetical protein
MQEVSGSIPLGSTNFFPSQNKHLWKWSAGRADCDTLPGKQKLNF